MVKGQIPVYYNLHTLWQVNVVVFTISVVSGGVFERFNTPETGGEETANFRQVQRPFVMDPYFWLLKTAYFDDQGSKAKKTFERNIPNNT